MTESEPAEAPEGESHRLAINRLDTTVRCARKVGGVLRLSIRQASLWLDVWF